MLKKEIALDLTISLKTPMEFDDHLDTLYEDLNYLGVAFGGRVFKDSDLYSQIWIRVSKPGKKSEEQIIKEELEQAVWKCIEKFLPQTNVSQTSRKIELDTYTLTSRFYDIKQKIKSK